MITDTEALDQIATFMGTEPDWNGGDICELVADLLRGTGRPNPDLSPDQFAGAWKKYLAKRES